MGRGSRQPKLFTPGIHISMKMADPAEGPSRTGFAPVVKGVLPDVVNISTSKVVKASDHPEMQEQEGMPGRYSTFLSAIFWAAIRARSEVAATSPTISEKTASVPA